MINIDAPALIDAVSKAAGAASTVKSKSLIQYTAATRITPFTLVDRLLLAVPELQDVLQVNASLYAGYYLMGVQLTVNSIDGVSVIRQLDKLKPTRGQSGHEERSNGGLMSVARTAISQIGKEDYVNYELGRESCTYRLPMGEPLKPLVLPNTLATESNNGKGKNNQNNRGNNNGNNGNGNGGNNNGGNNNNNNRGNNNNNNNNNEPEEPIIRGGFGRNNIETVTQDSNLAVGKLLEVVININGHPLTFPTNVRLNTFTAGSADIARIVANVDPHQSASEVKALYQAGFINLWDALTGKSAAKEWRKAAVEDKTGVILREKDRRSNNKFHAVMHGQSSFGDISGIYVISQSTARQVEAEIGGRLSNFSVREKMLANTGVMLLSVIDTDWKRVTIYHHSIDGASTYSFADLKRGGNSNNHDIGMVLEAFRQGQAPSKFF